LTGDLDLAIEAVGISSHLTWRNRPEKVRLPAAPGEVVDEGLGFPNGDRSMVPAYWMVEKLAQALHERSSEDRSNAKR
jgi:hypothetical protein